MPVLQEFRYNETNGKSHYGYKDHIKADEKSKPIDSYSVTDDSVHNSQETENLLEEEDQGQGLHADSAYSGQPVKEIVEDYEMINHIHEKGYKNTPLTEEQKESNHHKSKTRARDDWIEALNMAVDNNCPLGSREYDLHLMSDNGSQPTSEKYEAAATLLGIKYITTSYSKSKGNADTERFMRTFKAEIIYPNEFDSLEEARKKVDNFITFYNYDYPHSALCYVSPIEFEKLNKYKYVA